MLRSKQVAVYRRCGMARNGHLAGAYVFKGGGRMRTPETCEMEEAGGAEKAPSASTFDGAQEW